MYHIIPQSIPPMKIKNIKNKVKPKRRYQAKIINKNESILEKVNDEFAWRAVYWKQQANASTKNITARSIIEADLKSLQTKLRQLQWGRSCGFEENPQQREEATNLSSEYSTEETANQPFTNLTKMVNKNMVLQTNYSRKGRKWIHSGKI